MASKDERSNVEAELERLGAEVRRLADRIDALETRADRVEQVALRVVDTARVEENDAFDPGGSAGDLPAGLPALIGRTIIALGGAFLIRAGTESGAVPDGVGVAAGLAYALVWTWLADRAARAGRPLDATLHGLTTILVALPLIAETTARLKVMSPATAAISLTGVAGVVLGVAWLRKLSALAWIVTLASTVTGVALLFAVKSLSIFTPPLFVLAAASLAAAYHRDWYGLRWPAALALDVLVLLAMLLVGLPGYEWLQPRGVAAVQLLITAMYLGLIGARTLLFGHPTREFGIVQSLLVLAIGFEGARRMLGSAPATTDAFGGVALVSAALCYLVTFFHLDRDPRHRVNLASYTTLATILAVYGLALLVTTPIAGVLWAGMALAGSAAGTRDHRHALRWNVAGLAIAAGIGSGLPEVTYEAFWAADPRGWVVLPWPMLAAPGLCLAAWWLLRWRSAPPSSADHAVPGLVLLSVGAIGLGTAAIVFLGPIAAGASTARPDVAALAVLRTAVVVGASLWLAGLTRLRPRRELAWAAYAALAVAAGKIVIEDLPSGRALTMFLSFVLFGGALIVVPRLVAGRADDKSRTPVDAGAVPVRHR